MDHQSDSACLPGLARLPGIDIISASPQSSPSPSPPPARVVSCEGNKKSAEYNITPETNVIHQHLPRAELTDGDSPLINCPNISKFNICYFYCSLLSLGSSLTIFKSLALTFRAVFCLTLSSQINIIYKGCADPS